MAEDLGAHLPSHLAPTSIPLRLAPTSIPLRLASPSSPYIYIYSPMYLCLVSYVVTV